jgi:hypothetical protein
MRYTRAIRRAWTTELGLRPCGYVLYQVPKSGKKLKIKWPVEARESEGCQRILRIIRSGMKVKRDPMRARARAVQHPNQHFE